MKQFIKKYKYYIIIISIYILVYFYFFLFTKNFLSYFTFQINDLMTFIIILICSLPILYIANLHIKYGELGFNKKNLKNIIPIIFYATFLISIPEEIIFRGYIQSYLENIFSSNMFLNFIGPIFISSIIFGFAHIFNGAKGLKPKNWNYKLLQITFIIGIFLGIAYFQTNSLIVPIMLHTTYLLISNILIIK